jgi:hypothetical protein
MTIASIHVELPIHLKNLAGIESPVTLEVETPVTPASIVDALESRFPMLCGTIRDHVTKQRRPFLRYFACEKDWSHHPADTPMPEAVVSGSEPFIIWGAISGG